METILVGDNGNMLDGDRLAIADALQDRRYRDALRTARVDPAYTTLACLLFYGLLPLLGIQTSYALPSAAVEPRFRHLLTDDVLDAITASRQSPHLGDWLQYHHDQALYRALTDPLADYRTDIYYKIAKQYGIRVIDPYQDARLIQFVFDLPGTRNLQQGYNKAVFRAALSDLLPTVILERRKTDRVEGEELKGLEREMDYLARLLETPSLTQAGIVRDQATLPAPTAIIDAFKADHAVTWRIVSAHAWLDNRRSNRSE